MPILDISHIKPYGDYSALQIEHADALLFNSGGTSGRIPSITCTQATGALTFTLNPCVVDFRSPTSTSGIMTPRLINAVLSLVLPSGGTLGFVTTVSGRVMVLCIDVDANTRELAIINIAGGNKLDETGVISTTAISASSTAANVFYSTTARSNVSYRIVGAVDVVNTTGAWGNPSLVQGAGGNALTAMGSLGYGQTWQNVAGSRVLGTTYYNTTSRSVECIVSLSRISAAPATGTLTINGNISITLGSLANGYSFSGTFIVPPGASYVVTSSGGGVSQSGWIELR